jgi:BRCA1 C Terminus (BRCT) domain.
VKVPENNGSARRANHGPLLYVPDEDDSNDSKDGKTNGNKHTDKTKDVRPSTSEKKDGKGEKKKDSQGSEKKKDLQGSDKKKDSSKKEADSQRSNDSKARHDLSKKPQNPQTPTASVSGTSRKRTKPFSKLLEGVTFVISGFENPLRSDLRNQALEMGAYYKANWDGSCTHLV